MIQEPHSTDSKTNGMKDGAPVHERLSSNVSKGQVYSVKDGEVEPLAIVGFSARLPGDATTAEAFWRMLSERRTAHGEIPKDRFHADTFYHRDSSRAGTINVKWAHFLEGNIAAFDAPFFSIQPPEAKSMDPQQRFLLETTYRALENAGIPMDQTVGSRTAVYVGSSARDYEALQARDPEIPARYLGTGIGTALLANRVSWFYDLKGPSISLDTACSSSLSAMHLACQSLKSHESDMALVGGVNLMISPDASFMHLSNMGFFSPDGHCYSFDSRANGYAKGEGVGIVVVKRLADALRDDNTVRAVIRASGSNQDGRTPGITQPSTKAQEVNIRDTYKHAGLDLDKTQFFEAHGTGTQIGDPIEAEAIAAAFQRTNDNPLYVGAAKTNIGHLEAAAGIAGLIKAVLVLEKGLIPPNVFYEKPNAAIPLDKWNLRFPKELIPWPNQGLRRASVNSFGYGGTNVHVVLDDAYHFLESRGVTGRHHTITSSSTLVNGTLTQWKGNTSTNPAEVNGHNTLTSRRPRILVWSAADEPGLDRLVNLYDKYFSTISESVFEWQDEYLDNLSYTLSNKRSNLPWKAFLITASVRDLQHNLHDRLSKPVRSSALPYLTFIFSGQGAQWHAMGRELQFYPVFRDSLTKSEQCLLSFGCEWSLKEELQKDEKSSRIDDPTLSQPLCTALQLAMVDLLSSWKITPNTVVGHSSGEITAAYCVNGLSFESALKVAYYRGTLAAKLAKSASIHGAMTSIAMSEAEVRPYLEQVMALGQGEVVVGCVNSPKNVTVSGDAQCIDALNVLMEKRGIFARRLNVALAYHSPQMQATAAEYSRAIENIVPRMELSSEHDTSLMPLMFSSVSGTLVSPQRLSQAEYWITNAVSTVRFSEALTQLTKHVLSDRERKTGVQSGKSVYLEIGPHSALRRPVKDVISGIADAGNTDYDSLLERDVSAVESCLAALARLRCTGYPIDLTLINAFENVESKPQLLVDLPEYPFNHSHVFWEEPRMSKDFRFRKHPRHELLGSPSLDWNPMEPRWRNIIKMSENLWMQDHKMDGVTIYPAAGMLVMAIEAARQLADPTLTVTGYTLRDVQFLQALKVSSAPEGVETQLHFHPFRGSDKRSKGYHFALYVHSIDTWSQVCRGSITKNFLENGVEVDDGQESSRERSRIRDLYESGANACEDPINSSQFYDNAASYGCDFGPTHQVLDGIHYNDAGEAKASISLDSWVDKVSSDKIRPHVIHPTALDGVAQLAMAAFSQGSKIPFPTMVPTNVKSLWISNALLNRSSEAKLETYAKTTFRGYREADFWIAALNEENEPRIVVENWRQMSVTTLDAFQSHDTDPRRLCYKMVWQPDFEMLSQGQVAEHCTAAASKVRVPPGALVDRSELVALYFMSSTLEAMQHENFTLLSPHLLKYLEWIKHSFSQSKLETQAAKDPKGKNFLHDREYRDESLEVLAQSGAQGTLIVAVGQALLSILRGEMNPLDLLFSKDLVQKFYHGATFAMSYAKIAAYVDLLAHKNPSMRVLEVGAGTGAATAPIMQTLGCGSDSREERGIPRFERYDYTDISPAFFEKAKERYKSCEDRMNYIVLDVEEDPISQGFEANHYDVVVCGLVLHATTNLSTTLCNVRKLLKPGGKLLLLEPTNIAYTWVSFIFGLLPGWWLGTERNRQWGPLLADRDWDNVLKENGFSGTETCLWDVADPARQITSAIFSTAIEEPSSAIRSVRETLIVIAEEDYMQRQVAAQILSSMHEAGVPKIRVIPNGRIHSENLNNAQCIVLLELKNPYLMGIEEKDFNGLKQLVVEACGVLWVTQGAGEKPSRPELDLATGFGRNARSENWSLNFIHLAIETGSSTARTVEQILNVYQKNLARPAEECESEYWEKDGKLHIGRVAEAEELGLHIRTKTTRLRPAISTLGEESARALKLNISVSGLLDTFHFIDDHQMNEPLAPNEIEIRPKAVSLNFKDLLIALGNLSGSSLGIDCAGVVSRVGAEADFKINDRVCCCTTSGAFKTHVRALASGVAKIEDSLSFHSAAAMPIALCTAYYSLFHLAQLKEKETILIHSGAGGLGQAAIQLARLRNARIFTTVGTTEKKKLVMDVFGIPETQIFSSRNGSFAQAIMRLTNRAGVNVVLNSLSGENMRASWSCIAPLGRFIEVGKTDIMSGSGLPMDPFLKSVTFASVDLAVVMEKSEPLMKDIMHEVMALTRDGLVTSPQPLNVYSISDIEKAFRLMQSGKNSGKIVIDMDEHVPVPIVPSAKATYSFSENATYVISGGLGGIGRSIIRWMVGRNAKNFLLLSRSGTKSQAARELVGEMTERAINIAAPSCDISSESTVSQILETYSQTMPPFRGCIQAAMVLRDGLFENMSHDDFEASIKPKVQGSWNLHKHLPVGLDFFVMLSSIASVTGSRGQANYASGNSYQDALARHRMLLGQKAVSLNLGPTLSVGIAAETSIIEMLAGEGFEGIRENEMLALMDWACDPTLSIPDTLTQHQVITGLGGARNRNAEPEEMVYWMQKPLFSVLRNAKNPSASGSAKSSRQGPSIGALIAAATSPAAGQEVIISALAQKLMRALNIPLEDVDPGRPIHAFGVDSLVALEVRYWFMKEMKANIAVFDIMGSPSLRALAGIVWGKSEHAVNSQEMETESQE